MADINALELFKHTKYLDESAQRIHDMVLKQYEATFEDLSDSPDPAKASKWMEAKRLAYGTVLLTMRDMFAREIQL